MRGRTFHITAGVVFLVAGLFHIIRAVMSWTLTIQSFTFPVWFSYALGLFVLWLSYESFRTRKRKGHDN